MRAPLKAFDRLMSNAHLQAEGELVYGDMARWLRRSGRPVIVIDWSDLKADKAWYLLRAAVPVGGWALSVLDMVFPSKQQGTLTAEKCFLRRSLATTTVTTITYDAGDHVTSVTDPRGLATTYTYDGLGQLWQQTSPDTGTTAYAYDSAGRRSSMIRADGTTTSYGYDSLDRVTSVSAGGQVQRFAYDSCPNGLGRLCTVSDGTGTTAYSYTPEGWVSGRGFTVGSTSYTLNYSYDAEGHVSAVLYPDDNQASYSYTDGVVSGVTLTVNGAIVPGASAIIYRPGDQAMSGWTSSNGLTNTLSYDSDGRLTGIAVPGVESLGFGYDKANRVISRTDGIDTAQSEAFDYDEQSRLTGVYGGSDTESYRYDADGNRLTETINGVSASFGYSATSNRLLSLSGVFSGTYGYDPQGNTTVVNGATIYQYDAFNRLANSGAMDYVDPEGQRLRKSGGSTGTTYFAPDAGNHLLAENDNGAWVDYVWLNGRLVGRIAGSTMDAIHDDQTGRPQVVTAADKTVVWKADNGSFDRTVVQDDIGGLNLGFPGQYYDAERWMWNNGYRDYNAGFGRYNESDPVGLAGGINTYVYVGGNPLSQVDPLGLQDADADSPAEEPDVVREAHYLGPNQADPAWNVSPMQREIDQGECYAPGKGPNFIVTPGGTVYPVPEGASGPYPADNGRGMQFQGGSGGNGLDPRTSGFRYMDPVTTGRYQYPNGYGSYNNGNGQAVNPYTGRTIPPNDPMWHISNGN